MSALLITPLPVPPTRADPTNFNDRADEFLAAIEDPFVDEVNAISLDLTAKHSEVLSARNTAVGAASAAEASATAAANTANAAMWNAATNYGVGVAAISPINFQTYRRRVQGITSTDPSADPTNWEIVGNFYTKPEVDNLVLASTPAGIIEFHAAATVPTGRIKANGTVISRTVFSRLFARIGTTYGEGDGSTTFGTPDLRGIFVRGLDEGKGIDVDRVLGSNQESSISAHQHGIAVRGSNASHSHRQTGPAENYVAAGSSNSIGGAGNVYQDDGAISSFGGTETRPRNMALVAFITI